MQSLRLFLLLSLVWLVTFAGCGRSDRHPLGSVAGTVRYQGQPLASGTIIFEVAGARPANGTIVDGKIVEVTTYAPQDGAPVGDARIAVFATAPDSAARHRSVNDRTRPKKADSAPPFEWATPGIHAGGPAASAKPGHVVRATC